MLLRRALFSSTLQDSDQLQHAHKSCTSKTLIQTSQLPVLMIHTYTEAQHTHPLKTLSLWISTPNNHEVRPACTHKHNNRACKRPTQQKSHLEWLTSQQKKGSTGHNQRTTLSTVYSFGRRINTQHANLNTTTRT